MNASETVRTARSKSGLSQAELAVRAGLAQSVVSAYENRRREPSVETLGRLVAAAGFTLELELRPGPAQLAPFTGPVGRRVQRKRAAARALLTERGYGNIVVFGSVARGDDRADSDLDIVADLPPSIGFQLGRDEIDLEELLGVAVDLGSWSGLRPSVRRAVAEDGVPL